MFFLPHLYNTDDYTTDVDEDDLQEFCDHSTMCLPDYSEDFKEFALTIMKEHDLPEPHYVSSALDLYIRPLRGGKVNIIFLKGRKNNVKFLWTSNGKIMLKVSEMSATEAFTTHDEFEDYLDQISNT